MGKRTSIAAAKNGRTASGHVRDVKIDRVGPVTIYRRGDTYYLYYLEGGQRRRPRVEGNLAVAKATAADIAKALAEERPSPLTFQRTCPEKLVASYLSYVEEVQQRAWRTRQRYRAALDRFLDYARERRLTQHGRSFRFADRLLCFATDGGAIESIGTSTSLALVTAATAKFNR